MNPRLPGEHTGLVVVEPLLGPKGSVEQDGLRIADCGKG